MEKHIFKVVIELIDEIKTCEKAGANTSAIAMAFVCMDTMAYLSLPAGRETQGKNDFISWVDLYLKGHEDQPYQYRGLDVYGARCAILHAFGSDSDFHKKHEDAKKFGYHDGGKHTFNLSVDERLVVISIPSFLNDVVHAVIIFLEECAKNSELRERVEGRLPKLFEIYPIKT